MRRAPRAVSGFERRVLQVRNTWRASVILWRALHAIAAASLVALNGVIAAGPAFAAEPASIVNYSKAGNFEDVRDDTKAAIEARGLVIDYTAFIGRMLERTGKDVGSARPLYQDAVAFVFCSATLSRKTMEADLANLAMCPYSITVYATASEPGKVNVSYRRLARSDGSNAARASLAEVNALLDGIAKEAVGLKR